MLGEFKVWVDGRQVLEGAWRRKKPAALVKLLALSSFHRLHREQVIETLWPNLGPDAGGANLRKALHQARRAFEDAAVDSGRLISSDLDLVSFAPGRVWVDTEEFQSMLFMARRSGQVEEYRRALDSYGDGLLPEDRYEEWAEEARRELHLDFVAGLDECAGLLEGSGDVEGAIETARRVVAVEPLREEGHARLIRLYALAGRRQDALSEFAHLTRLLDEELGVEPSPDSQRLYEEIRASQDRAPEMTSDLWERVGDLRVMSGDASGAAKAFGLALGAEDTILSRSRLERKCAEAWLMQHRPEMAEPHLVAAELAAQPSDLAEPGRLKRARGNQAWESGDIVGAQQFAEAALEVAQRVGDPDDLAAALEAVAIVSHFRGEWRQGLETELERLASANDGSAELARVFDMHHCIGQYHLYGDGLFESVEGYARQILRRAEDARAIRAQAFAWCLLGESLLLQARWDESVGCLERSCEIHASLGSRSGGLPWQRRAELAVSRGDFEEAEHCLRESCAIATVSEMANHLWGRIYTTAAFAAVEQGDPERALVAIRAAAAAAARYGDCPTCSAMLNPIAAEAFALLGDPEGARGFAGPAERVGQMFESSAWRAMAESAAGSVAAASGNHDDAVAHFDAASLLYENAGQPYWSQRVVRLGSVATK